MPCLIESDSSAEEARRRVACWITIDPDLVAYIVEEILRQETWWAAVRSRKFACPATVWVDRVEGGVSAVSRISTVVERTMG